LDTGRSRTAVQIDTMQPRIAILAAGSKSGEIGGAERFYLGVRDALRARGADAQILTIINDESCFEAIEETYLRYYDLDLGGFDGVISTKAPGYVARHPNHVCYLQHTMRVFYDMFDREFPNADAHLKWQRGEIQRLDTAALQDGRIRKRFVIGHEVRRRLLAFNNLDAEVLYQATTLTGFRTGQFSYVFLPGRLHRWKRVSLAIESMRHVSLPVQMVISGTGEDERELKAQAQGDARIRFVGMVTDRELLEYYSNALVVPFVPFREDFGLVTLEAFHSRKPVITCSDSGEPANIVRDGVTGFICPPEPAAIGARIQQLAESPRLATAMGAAGADSIQNIRWDVVADKLLAALGFH
jgi:glycosyltransferase involved in cell wall biosynthesis